MNRALPLGGALFLLFSCAHGEVGKPRGGVYEYEISANGGMGAGLQIVSQWSGRLELKAESETSWIVIPSDTKASLEINGAKRQEITDTVVPAFERAFRVELDPELGSPKKIEAPALSPAIAGNAGLIALLNNQIREVSHLLLPPHPAHKRVFSFRAPCLLGACTYRYLRLEGDDFSFVRNATNGLGIEGRFEGNFIQGGVGNEDTVQDHGGASSHSTLKWTRIGPASPGPAPRIAQARTLGITVSELSLEEKRAALEEQLSGVTVESLHRRAAKLKDPHSNEWGNLYVQLKNILWLRPAAISELESVLQALRPSSRFYTTAVNALAANDTPEAQAALRNLLARTAPREKESLMSALAESPKPTAETISLILRVAEWENQNPGAAARQARLLLGTLARTKGDSALVAPALARARQSTISGPAAEHAELANDLEVLGNSGLPETASIVETVLRSGFSGRVRATAWLALRFVRGSVITDRLYSTASSPASADSKDAGLSLRLRCNLIPEECSEAVSGWVREKFGRF